jgi:branched-chain amino acid transport system substrate-binding protein
MARRLFTTLGLIATALLAGCDRESSSTSSTPAPASAPASEIVVGHFASMTGNEANFGIFTDNGIKLAIKQRNASGGVNGKPVRLITYDNQGKQAESATAVTRLITQDKVAAVLGEVASSRSLAGGQVAQRFGVPMISPSSTNPQVTEIGDMVFRVCFIDPFQGDVCAAFAMDRGWKRAAVLYDRTQAYSTGLSENFKQAFTKLGGEIVTEQAYSGGDAEFGAQLTAIRAANADIIFIPGYYNDVGNIAIQVRRLGLTMPLLGSDGWTGVHSQGPQVNAAIEGSFYSDHYSAESDSAKVQAFLKDYQAEFGVVPDSMAALGYDAANILFAAMEKAPSLAGADLAAAIAATRDFDGVTGLITIDEKRNARKPAVILQLKDGKPTYVTTIAPR